MRDQVHKKQNFTHNFDPKVVILVYFSSRRSRETKSRDEVFFETRPSRYRPKPALTHYVRLRANMSGSNSGCNGAVNGAVMGSDGSNDGSPKKQRRRFATLVRRGGGAVQEKKHDHDILK